MSLAMNNRDDERIGKAVTHQRCYRRTQPHFVIVETFSLPDETRKIFLLVKKLAKWIGNGRGGWAKNFRRRKFSGRFGHNLLD